MIGVAVDVVVSVLVVGGMLWSLVLLLLLGLGRSAAVGDEWMEAYVEEELKAYDRAWDVEEQSWVYTRRAS